jgi:hypothetical protein
MHFISRCIGPVADGAVCIDFMVNGLSDATEIMTGLTKEADDLVSP